MLRLTLLTLLLAAAPNLWAEQIHKPMLVLKQEKCNSGGGFYLWDSKKCLFENDAIWLGGKLIPLEEKKRLKLRSKRGVHTENIGDVERIFYAGEGVTVRIDLELIAGCNYLNEQCTYRNYRASFVVHRLGKPLRIYQGVGYGGS